MKCFYHNDIDGQVSRIIDSMMKDIEKGKNPSCSSITNALEDKINFVKEVFKVKNNGEKKPDWVEILKELKNIK